MALTIAASQEYINELKLKLQERLNVVQPLDVPNQEELSVLIDVLEAISKLQNTREGA